ncbi:bifunctional 2-C-methyl-D-erythritol 4-phosphate cytidylyltransferase/2-C-methyl-D-erythritol 2,4-cyclodiphosphate synthase [Amaricoccus sp.]|uniref:bifunctional 2-C-methyl-D-erythritol 4-phosphate cytidylyltransferase/2-C-methyl-D-erythritol 2,4-cyclodiphosphate synthase n=1 Tax=Amaricoccus sp. TaxID=1872485 RepID=UPI001B6AC0EC|nr:bifunctional 2-C-methyl-D-erythritol 4-phosphate cytidylyltransferase/2-C-methyl-D-erythritol 2,4-cyclodiphosphate synthase [Amaricoccus sp.]MBP7000741.1 bifunctional 2-C-methyl-D-erythritol 4-phosphate cytidylyltransferase/2-C-methyl-D-erythritol 2,4-cyclodiphosphate synthase [Amaricoccus sp.]
MQVAGLIVAAGRGERLGGDTPKQYLRLGDAAILARAARALLVHPAVDAVQVVIAPGDDARYAAAMAGLADPRLLPPVAGGADRAASVRAGLEALAPHAPGGVLIHDAARPFLAGAVIDRVLAALDDAPAAFPALPVVDALWRGAGGNALAPAPRDGLWRAQTPQGFRFDAILAAHRAHPGAAADDAAVARAAGLAVALVEGDEANYKITGPADLARARRDIGRSAMDVRTGNGFDVHAFGPGDHVTLCGVRLPFGRGLVGHSDADVGMHAVTDAILGALAEGDIGRWFPPSDPQWKGAASEIFLRAAAARAVEAGFAITHLDCTLVCEAPKIGPHAAEMRAALAVAAGVGAERVSVKATTSERLGFTGREEGVAALATATLVRPMEARP